MKKLSVIVPVYNVEPYLEKCLDSILAQSVADMEILVIDDGSPDNCGKIIDHYAERFPDRLFAFHKPNGGLSDARNFGIERTSGEYIAFVDSDDYISPDMYRMLLEKAESQSFDMVVCDLNYVYLERTKCVSSNISNDLTSPQEVKSSMTCIYPAAWNKLFHRRLFSDGIRFKKGVWFEDVEFLYRLYPSIKNIGVVHSPLYQYVQRENSITASFDMRRYDYLDNWLTILESYISRGLFESYKYELQYSCVRYMYATFLKSTAQSGSFSIFMDSYRKAKALVSKYFRHTGHNPYFYKNGFKGIYLLTFNYLTALLVYLFFK